MTDQPAPVIEAGPPADVIPRRRARRQPAWRLLLAHVRPHRWMLLGGGLLGFLGATITPEVRRSPDMSHVTIVYHVVEGTQYHVAGVQIDFGAGCRHGTEAER